MGNDNWKSPWAMCGAWLQALRRDREITPAELAEQVGAPSGRWVEEVEAGVRAVPSSLYRGYARLFGLPLSDFAAACLKHYDRKAYDALFGDVETTVSRAA